LNQKQATLSIDPSEREKILSRRRRRRKEEEERGGRTGTTGQKTKPKKQ
jgi:hypothetical protein